MSNDSVENGRQPDFRALVNRIQGGDKGAIPELRGLVEPGIRHIVGRHFGIVAEAEVTAIAQSSLETTIADVLSNEITDAKAFQAHLRRAVLKTCEARYGHNRTHQTGGPERAWSNAVGLDVLHRAARQANVLRVLAGLPCREREIVTRFYVQGQTPAQICDELGLQEQEFQILKANAQRKFDDIVRKPPSVQFMAAKAAIAGIG